MKHVCHWEIAAKNAPALQNFYHQLFDWQIDANNPMNYGLTRSGGLDGNGIDGGIYQKAEKDPAFVTFYVMVEDLQVYLDKAVSLGGTVLMPPVEIPGGGGHIAMFTDPDGNRIGLYKE